MLGAIIGDLAAWTWEHDKGCFYRQLVNGDAVLSDYGTTLSNIARVHLQKKSVDISPIGTPPEPTYMGQWLMWQIADAWYNGNIESRMPTFYCVDKEEGYARMFVKHLITSLLNGSTKSEAYHSCYSFKEFSKSWPWRDDSRIKNEHSSGLITYILRAWNAFYLGFDFTSTIHNAVKWSDDIHLTAAIAGAFASAMYGCDYNYIKRKYSTNNTTCTILADNAFEKKEDMKPLIDMMKEKDFSDRKFFKKNCALTNVEKHTWVASGTDLSEFVFDEKERMYIIRAWYTDWDNRYGFYLDDGWVYFYRSHVICCRFQLERNKDGKYHIVNLQDIKGAFHNAHEVIEVLQECKARASIIH